MEILKPYLPCASVIMVIAFIIVVIIWAVLGIWLRGVFPSCGLQGLLSSSVWSFQYSGFSCHRAWALGCPGSVAAALAGS